MAWRWKRLDRLSDIDLVRVRERHDPLFRHRMYPAHREHEYQYLMDDQDREYFKWIDVFNKYDLYTKSAEPPNVDELRPFYEDRISELLLNEISF